MLASSKKRGVVHEKSALYPVGRASRGHKVVRSAIEPLENRLLMTATATYIVTGHGDGPFLSPAAAGLNTYTAATLRDAVIAANLQTLPSVINFLPSAFPGGASNIITLTLPGSLAMTNLTHTYSIVGPTAHPVTVDGNGTHTVFTTGNGVSAEIDNLTIQHGIATINHMGPVASDLSENDGGGIAAYGPLVLKGDTFTGNAAAAGVGGGVYSQTGTISSTNCNFTANTAIMGGGAFTFDSSTNESPSFTGGMFNLNTAIGGGAALFNQSLFNSTLTLTNVAVTSNSTPSDSAITSLDVAGKLTTNVSGCTFTSNVGGTLGGALYSGSLGLGLNTTLNVTGSTFKSNNATAAEGGAIFSDDLQLNVTGSTFTGNLSEFGSDIFADGLTKTMNIGTSSFTSSQGTPIFDASASDVVTITGSTFTNNTGPSGGGIFTFGKSLSVSTTTFTNNHATVASDGGAIEYLGGAGTSLALTTDTFTNNLASTGMGGAVFEDTSTLTITGTKFTGNSAGGVGANGGAVYNTGETGEVMTLTNDTFSNNSANQHFGSGFYNDGALGTSITITGSSFTGNSSESGAVDSEANLGVPFAGSSLTVTNTTFSGNVASAVSGSAIFSADDTLTLSGDSFDSNSTLNSDGGAVWAGGLSLSVDTSTFSNDLANGNGGAIFAQVTGDASITNSTFTNEQATNASGGALDITSATLELNGDTFTGNTSSGLGGAVVSDVAGIFTISNSTFTDNTSQFGGGGVEAQEPAAGGSLFIFNSTFNGNDTAFGGGGGVNSAVDVARVANSTFFGNSAGSGAGGGGGLAFTGAPTTASVTDSTFDANSAFFAQGGGISTVPGSAVVLRGDIVAGNVSTGSTSDNDLAGAFSATSSFNLIGDGTNETGVVSSVNGNIVGTPVNPVDPQLAPLANNGGTTQTQLPASTSQAIDNGANFIVLDQNFNDVTAVDQRGTSRPQGNGYDIGAVEVVPASPPDHLVFLATPATVTAGAPFGVTVEAFTNLNFLDNTFSDTVVITSSDAAATGLPAGPVTFVNGTYSFTPALNTAGSQTFTATDTTVGSPVAPATSNPIIVTAPVVTVPTINITNASAAAPLAGSATIPMTFTVTLSAASAQTVTVAYGTMQGTASSQAGDYTGIPATPVSTLTFAPGQTSKTITVQIKKVTGPANKYPKFFYVLLTNANNAILGSATGIGTINF